MKDILLKIIKKHCQLSSRTVIDRSASELADMMQKFEMWKMKNSWYNSPANDYTAANEKTYKMMLLTYADLFSYWYTEIYTK